MQAITRASAAVAVIAITTLCAACRDNPAGVSIAPSAARMDGGVTFGSGAAPRHPRRKTRRWPSIRDQRPQTGEALRLDRVGEYRGRERESKPPCPSPTVRALARALSAANEAEATVDLSTAATLSGFTRGHLRRLYREGKLIAVAVERGEPLFRVSDLPRKPSGVAAANDQSRPVSRTQIAHELTRSTGPRRSRVRG